jgi:hypothetical protein
MGREVVEHPGLAADVLFTTVVMGPDMLTVAVIVVVLIPVELEVAFVVVSVVMQGIGASWMTPGM